MGLKRALVFVVGASMALTGLSAGPATAEVGGGAFQCSGTFPQWPGAGFTTCEGLATGVYREGPDVVVCRPFCNYSMTMAYVTTCIPPAPSSVAAFDGHITISDSLGTFDTPYSGVSVGPNLVFITESPVGAGDAVIALLPPIPTCAAPSQASFLAAGALAFD